MATDDSPVSLVTGACGFIGTHMVEVLSGAGHRVRATDLEAATREDDRVLGRFPSVVRNLKDVELTPSDMTRPETLAPLVSGVDYVFHIASIFSYSAPAEALNRVNVLATRQLLDLLLREKKLKRIVVWGAGGVYGIPGPEDLPLREDLAPSPPNNYLRSKWRQEFTTMEYGRRHGLPYTIIRPTTVYGPRAVYGSGQLLLGTARQDPVLAPANFDGRVPFVHVRDVCRAALYLAEHEAGKGEVFNVSDDSTISSIDVLRFIAEITGHRFVMLPPVPIEALRPLLRLVARGVVWLSQLTGTQPPLEPDVVEYLGRDFVFSNEKLKATGFRFLYPDARDGIRDTIRWYRENGWL